MNEFKVPLIIRGEIIEDYEVDHVDRTGGLKFKTPDTKKYVKQLVLSDPLKQWDMYEISLEDILDFLHAVGERLDLDTNPHWRQAFDISCFTTNLSRPVVEASYRACQSYLDRERVRERINIQIGANYLEGWVPNTLADGRTVNIRAIGARGVHIIAGNFSGQRHPKNTLSGESSGTG